MHCTTAVPGLLESQRRQTPYSGRIAVSSSAPTRPQSQRPSFLSTWIFAASFPIRIWPGSAGDLPHLNGTGASLEPAGRLARIHRELSVRNVSLHSV